MTVNTSVPMTGIYVKQAYMSKIKWIGKKNICRFLLYRSDIDKLKLWKYWPIPILAPIYHPLSWLKSVREIKLKSGISSFCHIGLRPESVKFSKNIIYILKKYFCLLRAKKKIPINQSVWNLNIAFI